MQEGKRSKRGNETEVSAAATLDEPLYTDITRMDWYVNICECYYTRLDTTKWGANAFFCANVRAPAESSAPHALSYLNVGKRGASLYIVYSTGWNYTSFSSVRFFVLDLIDNSVTEKIAPHLQKYSSFNRKDKKWFLRPMLTWNCNFAPYCTFIEIWMPPFLLSERNSVEKIARMRC